uniref:Uncharacterized protein n=1 Tax=Bracon brevicornis TaxID=1563983 RepID=A0A6V7ITE7_9HYME
MIMRLNENGLTGLHLQRVIDKRVSLNLREVFIEKDGDSSDEAVALRLKPLAAAFMLLCAGNLMATVVFYFELKKKKDVKDNRFLSYNRNKLVLINQEFKAIRGLKKYRQIDLTQPRWRARK